MKRKHTLGAAATATLLAVLAGLAGLSAWRAHSEAAPPAAAGEAARAHETDTEPGVSLDQEARERAGIETADARASEAQAPTLAIATVLPMQELIDAAASSANARAQAERADAALEASRRDHERVKGLHALERNASDRALESAEAAWRADAAGAQAAGAALQAAQASARARWGAALTQSMVTRGGLWLDLEAGRQLLLRVTAASGPAPVVMPASMDVELASESHRRARLIAQSPTSDPRVQGPAYFYAMDGLGAAVGQTLQAHIASGAKQSGAWLPAGALLWWQGRQWAYVEEAPGRFERREAADARRVEGGWFVPGFKPARVASRGAQSLLSQELRAAIKLGEDDK